MEKDIKVYDLNKKKKFSEMNLNELFYAYKHSHNGIKRIHFWCSLPKEKRNQFRQFLINKVAKQNEQKKDFDNDNVFEVRNFNFWYGKNGKHVLKDINIDIKKNKVTALIGPSGCGKSTFLRNLNQLNDLIEDTVYDGEIFFLRTNTRSVKMSQLELRTRVGMVFQKPTPFEMSIYDNVAFGPKNNGITDKLILDEIVENALKQAALWDEVKEDLDKLGSKLSGGQQQRLCIARAIALQPEVLLMDEPTSALDPIATSKVEKLIIELKEKYSIIIVTHSMTQAQRISDYTALFYEGRIEEYNDTKSLFTKPQSRITKDYITGKIA
ncbi:phosphate ABC transporter ATP-binding protein PstB [Ureaplasma canigenitalium]|uniref:phosphate ABC transporter ATP-binding protein PstB n=1 Tax=Ureaplasma canigenitalium TaxID=42092 RepID=UPI0004E0E613|nr:phosphate ABC transporter ATP-binding protein PstB [Ureaplasma canigenitalium]